MAICKRSFSHAGYNLLDFRCGNKSIYIVQHVTACDVIYIPEYNLLKLNGHTPTAIFDEIYSLYIKNSNDFSAERVFGGVVTSHGRPSHFHYDVGMATRVLFNEGLLSLIDSFYHIKGSDFEHIAESYALDRASDIVLDAEEMQDLSLQGDKFFIKLGLYFKLSKHASLARQYDVKLMHFSIHNNKKLKPEIEKLSQCYPVVWLGVTTQKRSWIEQVDGYSLIIKKLYEIYPNLGVVFDGWTSPLTPSNADEIETQNDQRIVSKIIQNIPSNINTLSIVGQSSRTKLNVANVVDFAVTNQMTGGMHIARMAQKNVITHISQDAYPLSLVQNIMPNAIHYPTEDVRDVPDPKMKRVDFTSYSISPESMSDFVLQILTNLLKDN
jgi:hypothetical protein